MADRLNGYRILILETREEAQFSRLLQEQGASVLQCPMFTIHDAPDPAPIEAWIRRAIERPFDDLVLMTGEGLRRLMNVVRKMDVEQPFIALGIGGRDHVARSSRACRCDRRGAEGTQTPYPVASSRFFSRCGESCPVRFARRRPFRVGSGL